jgi:hypothetical protein
LQQLVAGIVSERVVDPLEVIEVRIATCAVSASQRRIAAAAG